MAAQVNNLKPFSLDTKTNMAAQVNNLNPFNTLG